MLFGYILLSQKLVVAKTISAPWKAFANDSLFPISPWTTSAPFFTSSSAWADLVSLVKALMW